MTGHPIAERRRDKSPLEEAAMREAACAAENRLALRRRDVEAATREAARRRSLLAFGVPLTQLLRPYAPAAGCVALLWLLRLMLAAPWDLSAPSAALLTVGVAAVGVAALFLGVITFLSATAETVTLLTTRKRQAADAAKAVEVARARRHNAARDLEDTRRSGRR